MRFLDSIRYDSSYQKPFPGLDSSLRGLKLRMRGYPQCSLRLEVRNVAKNSFFAHGKN